MATQVSHCFRIAGVLEQASDHKREGFSSPPFSFALRYCPAVTRTPRSLACSGVGLLLTGSPYLPLKGRYPPGLGGVLSNKLCLKN